MAINQIQLVKKNSLFTEYQIINILLFTFPEEIK